MDGQVVWLRAALDDLDKIGSYIASDSPRYAANFMARVLSTAAELYQFPRMGPRVPEWDRDDLRQRIIHRYRLIYRLKPGRIEILGVLHGARMLPDAMKNRA